MSVRNIRDALETAYSGNVRKSFFGGVVSSRLQAQDLGRVVTAELEKAQHKSQTKGRNSNGAGSSRQSPGAAAQSPSQPQRPVDSEAAKAARREAQIQQRKKAAARNASMFDGSAMDSSSDAFAPVKPAAVAKPGRVSLTQKLGSAVFAQTPNSQGNSQKGAKTRDTQQRAHSSQQQQRQGARPGLNLQPTTAQKATKNRKGQSLTALRSKAELKAKAARGGGKQQALEKSLPPAKPKPTKVCRNCQTETPLKAYFCEKRCPDGLMHMCIKCASKKGLSGKPATPEIIAAIMHERHAAASIQGGARQSAGRSNAPIASHGSSCANGAGAGPSSMPSSARGGPPHPRSGPVGQQRKSAPSMQLTGSLKGFYGSERREAGPVARMVASGGHRRQREDLDRYEDDFVEDEEEEEDWRAQLREVTGGWRRQHEELEDEDDDRMMEASAADMRREEARSKRLGRREDIAAEREEAERITAKAAAKRARAASKPKKRKKKTGVNVFVNDEASDEDDDSEDYSE